MALKETTKVVIGIDPGKSGGVCIYDGNNIEAYACPQTVDDMASKINSTVSDYEIEGVPFSQIEVAIENVHAFPTDTKSSSFKFGTNFGMWLGILASNKLEVTRIQPIVWMKSYGEYPKEKLERKRYFKILASAYYQDLKVTLKTADAILIAKYYYERREE